MRFVIGIVIISFALFSCADENYLVWKEEVKLSDGRVIVVEQKKRCEGAYTGQNYAACIAREAWLTINLPEFDNHPIVWHENLTPAVVNISNGQLFIIGRFPTMREFRMYGSPKPAYISFVWKNKSWQRIPFEAVPSEIYDVNMEIESVVPDGVEYLSVSQKDAKRSHYKAYLKRLNPEHVYGNSD